MTRVVHITTVHPRYDTRIFRKEASSLHAAGHDVHLIVADGKGDELASGVHIHDVGRVSGRPRRMLLLPWRALRAARSLRPDIVHFHDPELLPIGLMLRWMGYRVIYDAHEDLPRALFSKHWLAPRTRAWVSRISELVENFCARRMSAVVTATPHIARRFEQINDQTVCVTNYPDLADLKARDRENPESRTFVYVGAITRKRAIWEMLSAIELADARLLLAGPFEDAALAEEVKTSPAWSRVEYFGILDHSRIWSLMDRALAGLLFFHPEPNHIHSVPNKMFEYMAGSLPILCSDFPDWQDIVLKNDMGLAADPLDPNAIAALMRRIIDEPAEAAEMGRRGRAAVQSSYRWENEARKLVELYRGLSG
jgi:glycosyltransferase involved in cell wall biosynthesis